MRAIYQFHISELNSKFLAYIHSLFKNKQIKIIITDEDYSELPESKDETKEWVDLSKKSLAGAYSEEEPEYTLNMIKEPNPEYERW
jgi:hypothetical protein